MKAVREGYLGGFDRLLYIPLVFYTLCVATLIGGVFLSISPVAVRNAFGETEILYAIWLSLATSTASTLLAVIVSVPASYVLSRRNFFGKEFLDTFLDLPIVLPPLVLGLTLLIFFNTTLGRFIDDLFGFVYNWRGIILVQFITGCSYALRVVKSGFDEMNVEYEHVAMVLGADRRRTFLKITLPIVRRSIISGAVICWARIFGLFGPILLVCGTMRNKTEIMPTTIFLETSTGRIEVALVIGASMILISAGTLAILKRVGKRSRV